MNHHLIGLLALVCLVSVACGPEHRRPTKEVERLADGSPERTWEQPAPTGPDASPLPDEKVGSTHDTNPQHPSESPSIVDGGNQHREEPGTPQMREPVPDVVVTPEHAGPETSTLPEGPPNPPGFSLYLYDEDNNTYLTPLKGTIDLQQYQGVNRLNIALKYDTALVLSARFQFDQMSSRLENAAPFTVFAAGDHKDKLTVGTHTITSTAYGGLLGKGKVLAQFVTRFTIKNTGSGSSNGLPANPYAIPPDPTFKQTKSVTKTIVISKPGVYDFKNVLHIWKGSGSCIQKENQPHILRIAASDVTVKNFAYRNAPDGIHIATCGSGQGNTCSGNIRNIVLENVTGWACEDALTTGKGTSHITIKRSFFLGNPNKAERDKCIQVNFGEHFRVEDTIFKNCKRPIRFKSGSSITVVGSRFYMFEQALKGDTFKDISGIIPNRQATVFGEKNHFQEGKVAYYMEGKIKATSTQDTFRNVRDKKYTQNGASVSIK